MTWERFGLALAAFLGVQAYLDLKKRIGKMEEKNISLEVLKVTLEHIRADLQELKADFKTCSDCKISASA